MLEFVKFRRHYSHQILIRMVVFGIAVIFIASWNADFIYNIYFKDQRTATGLIINGSILALFCLGLFKMIVTFAYYAREENALISFLKKGTDSDSPINNINSKSIIAIRFRMMETLFEKRILIDHGMLASTLIATESTRASFPKFINNTLILTGVFGTIVSLSIALMGASDLLENTVEIGGMGIVIHGMSTALTTTITAIVCYVFFGYFYLKLTDAQTNLISAIEQTTATFLLPRFQLKTDSVLYEFSGLIRSLQGLVNQMNKNQDHFEVIEKRIVKALEAYHANIENLSTDMTCIKRLLHDGFRLPGNMYNQKTTEPEN